MTYPFGPPSSDADGYQVIMYGARLTHDPSDQFGWVQGWRFAICKALLFDFGYLAPGFRTAASDAESWEIEAIRSLYTIADDSLAPGDFHWEDDLKRALEVLDRYRRLLALTGKDY
jgi:hypothetical protein